jgi:hypothetical protein
MYSTGNGDHGVEYFYGGGTDTLEFTNTVTGTGTIINVNVLDSLYTSVSTEANSGSTGINVIGSTTSGSSTTNTTIAYVLGASNTANITVSEVSQSTFDSVSSLG